MGRGASVKTPIGDRLILLLVRHNRTEVEDAWVRGHIDRVEDWPGVWKVARDNRVAPRVCGELLRMDLLDRVPEDVREHFVDQRDTIETQNRRRIEAGKVVLQAMVDAGIDVIVLKGSALGPSVYGDVGYKRMNDIDICVRRADVRRVMEIYAEHGFLCVGERVAGDAEKQVEVTHYLPPFVNRDVSCMFGTQWDFRSPKLGHDFRMDRVWERSLPLDFDGVPLRMLSPADMLHHICLHLERYKTGARDLMDIHNVIFAARGTLDWDRFVAEVEHAGTFDDTWYGLAMANAHRPSFEAEDALARLEPRVRRFVRRLAAHRTRSPEVLLRICSRQFATIEKAVSEFNVTHVFREKLPRFFHAWGTMLWPGMDDALKICGFVEPTPRNQLVARVVAPKRLLQAIAEELSWLLLGGLVIKSTLDVLLSLLPLGKKQDLNAYAEKLGMTPQQLRAVMEHVQ